MFFTIEKLIEKLPNNKNFNKISGKITSSIYSPRLKKNIGLAIINKRSREVTEGYSVKINDESLNIKIKELPFLRNK